MNVYVLAARKMKLREMKSLTQDQPGGGHTTPMLGLSHLPLAGQS
jgi:hypothetical protein